MNAPFRMPVTLPQPNELAGLLASHRQIAALREERPDLPDEVYDSLATAELHIEEEITGADVESSSDIATKLRLLADLMDSDDGEHRSELPLLLAILQNVADFRNPLWRMAYRRDHPLALMMSAEVKS